VWSDPILVEEGKGLIDPCPFWDTDGQAYLVHGWAGSRSGIKSVLTIKKMNAEGTKVIDEGKIVFDGHETDPTVEAPSFISEMVTTIFLLLLVEFLQVGNWCFVPKMYIAYERKVVMNQGNSPVNGPHQGAWVDTPTGEDWFLHFQDKDVYGRVVHLQPMKWVKDWPVIGNDPDGDGIGEPVMTYRKPNVGKTYPIVTPAESDEFEGNTLGLQWQWQANPKGIWHSLTNKGSLRLYSQKVPDNAKNNWEVPNILLQKFPTEKFTATTKLVFTPNQKLESEKVGLIILGKATHILVSKAKVKRSLFNLWRISKGI
jgi:beta-xylosidase